jgi:cytochrome P450
MHAATAFCDTAMYLTGIIDKPYNSSFKKYHQLSLNILKNFGFGKRIMETRINVEVEELVAHVNRLNGEPFNPDALVTSSVMNVIASMLFGHRFNHADPVLDELVMTIDAFFQSVSKIVIVDLFPKLRFWPNLRKQLAYSGQLHGSVLALLEKKMAEADGKDVSFVSYFRDMEGPDYDRTELLYLVRDFIMAGTETSAITIKWALVLLANHQDVQDRLHQEIDSVVDRRRLPSLDDRPNLPYVEAAILELMRCKTIAPLALLHETTCDTQVCGYHIPAGTVVCPAVCLNNH